MQRNYWKMLAMQKQLFEGFKITEPKKTSKSYIKRFKDENNYRKSEAPNWCTLCANSFFKVFETAQGLQSKLKCKCLGESNSNKTDVNKTFVCDKFKKGDSNVGI